MPSLGSPTLDQLRTFVAIVEAGGFSAAARRLGRAQSAVSYTVAALEEQLGGTRLFDRATRRPTLTEAGALLLGEARRVTRGVDGLLARAGGLLEGLEAELAVVVEVMLPSAELVGVLAAFRAAFPTVTLRLAVETLGTVAEMVLGGSCTVGVCGPLALSVSGLEHRAVAQVRLLHVAAPAHPLARLAGPVPPDALRDHVQLVLTDRSGLTRGRDFGVFSTETWRLGDLGAKHALLLAGLGWGSMPESTVRADLAAGRLVRLAIAGHGPVDFPLFAVHRSGAPPGPAGRWFLDRLAAAPGFEPP